MLRIAVIAVALCLACRWLFGKWPWEYLKPAATHRQAVTEARKLLALPRNAGRQDIVAAHKRLVAKVHPDRGGSSAQVHQANAARDLLLDELPRDGD